MSYKKKQKKSLLLYYDYIEQFELLNDKQFRQLIYAMIEFDKNKQEPKLDEVTKMAFIPIKRKLIEDKEKWEEICKNNSENVKKRWEKAYNVEDTTVYERIRRHTNYTDIDKEKDKDKEKDSERENNIISSHTPTPHPLFSDVLSFGQQKNIDEEYCKKFYNHYEAIGWVNGAGQQIKNWKLVFENWIKKDNKVQLVEDDYVDEAGFHYKNGRRML